MIRNFRQSPSRYHIYFVQSLPMICEAIEHVLNRRFAESR
jgi:hypothetical protein